MEQYGNTTTFNLETVLRENIIRSQYWEKTCIDLEGWQEVVDEIYYRLCQLKPTPQQIRMMLDHKDSPYIRAVGFLYLRYVCNPRELWGWCKKYLRDEEEFSPSPGSLGKTITMADFVRDILLDQYYFETIFPRIPKTVQDEMVTDLKSMGLPTAAKGNAGQGGADRRGVDDGGKRPASVKASLSVAFGQRAPNRAGAREEGRGMGAGMQGGTGASRKRSPSAEPYREQQQQQQRRRSRSPGRSERDQDRERVGRDDKYDRHRSDRDKDRDRDRDRDYPRRDRERDARDEGRRRDYDSRRQDDRRYDDRSRGGYERQDRDRERDRHRDEGGSRRSPGRDRDEPRHRDRDDGRNTRDVFQDKAGKAGGSLAPKDRLKDIYG